MRTIDQWLIARVRVALDFLFDWFGITQKLAERTLIVFFGLSNFVEFVSILLKIPSAVKTHPLSWQWHLFVSSAMVVSFWRRHRLPSAARAAESYTPHAIAFRFALLAMSVFVFICFCLGWDRDLYSFSVDVDAWSFTLLFYIFATDIDGERKSKKLAWSKIKELFGTEWIPQPIGGER